MHPCSVGLWSQVERELCVGWHLFTFPCQTHSIYTSWHEQARQKQNCIGLDNYLNVKLGGGLGACSPRKIFWIWCCEMASEAIFGPKLEITTNLCFRPGLVTEFWFTSCLDTWRQVSISGFKPPGNRVKEPLMQAGQLVLSSSKQRQPRMCGYALKFMICSFSGLRSSLLCPDCYVRSCGHGSVQMIQASCLQAKGRRCYLSQNIGQTVVASAGPVLPPLNCQEKCLITIQHPAKSGNIAVTYIEKWLDIQQLIGWIIYLCEMCTTLPDNCLGYIQLNTRLLFWPLWCRAIYI